MIINHNMQALNAHRQMGINQKNATSSMEKLSSGLRINKAGDDAAGLAISEKMRGQIRGLDQANRNAQDGISMIQTAEGALQETHSILQRMRELSVQAASDTLQTQDSEAIGEEMVALKEEINRIASTTQFNGKKILDGSLSAKLASSATLKAGVAAESGKSSVSSVDVTNAKAGSTFTVEQGTSGDDLKITLDGVSQEITLTDDMFNTVGKSTVLDFDKLGIKITLNSEATDGTAAGAVTALAALDLITDAGSSSASILVGANGTSNETITIGLKNMDATSLDANVGAITKTSVNTVDDAKTMITNIDNAIKNVSEQRSKLGAVQNRLEHTMNNLGTSSENLTAAESRVRDVDMAKEMMTMSKNNILQQASQAMLAQANQNPQQVLQLLR